MNAHSLPAGIRPHRYSAKTYAAFRIADDGRTAALRHDDEPGSVDDALNAILPLCIHKDKIAIRETDDEGSAVLHIYAIRKRAPRWVHEPGEFGPRRVEDLFAEPVCSIDLNAVGLNETRERLER